jgi:hypothetical protein
MLLYHYSRENITENKLKTAFFGCNSWTEYSASLSSFPRLYFYKDRKKTETFFFGAPFLYVVKVNKKKIYNVQKDSLKLCKKQSTAKTLKKIKRLGFIGVSGTAGALAIVELFQDTKIYKKINLTRRAFHAIL